MKGFIEITYIDDTNKKSLKMLINIRNILRVSVADSTYYKTEIELTSDKGYLAVETYEEIKNKNSIMEYSYKITKKRARVIME